MLLNRLRLRLRRPDADTLTWEYLDGEITPSRAEQLSTILTERADARQRFVEAAVMHGMLFDYFKRQNASEQTQEQTAEQGTSKRRKTGRSSAA